MCDMTKFSTALAADGSDRKGSVGRDQDGVQQEPPRSTGLGVVHGPYLDRHRFMIRTDSCNRPVRRVKDPMSRRSLTRPLASR